MIISILTTITKGLIADEMTLAVGRSDLNASVKGLNVITKNLNAVKKTLGAAVKILIVNKRELDAAVRTLV